MPDDIATPKSSVHPVVTGYYRYTDIYYSWPQTASEDPTVRSVLKAFLSPVSLANPDHPLRKDNPQGVQLFQGTLQNYMLRLLFESKQVEYMRYWIQAMGYTGGKPLSIPNSNYLMTIGHELRAVSPVIYTSAKALKDAHKLYDKHNKRLRIDPEEEILDFRRNFECIRNCWHAKRGTWCAIDFETWEIDHRLVTEIGLSHTSWVDGEEHSESHHIIVHENRHLVNHQYVRGNRDNFLFGTSKTTPLDETKKMVADIFSKWQQDGPLFLIFHGRHDDIRILQKWKAPIENLFEDVPPQIPTEGTFTIDTSDMFATLQGNLQTRKKLELMCRLLHLPGIACFHNAGNDAHFTMQSLKSMAGGQPLDAQREARWPHQSIGSFTVDFKDWQLDSDYSDMEGVVPIEDEEDDDENVPPVQK